MGQGRHGERSLGAYASLPFRPVLPRLGVLLALLCLLAAAGCGGDEGRKAASADRFVDSVGVNVHMSYNDTAYRDVEAVRAALQELGVRHVRDGLVMGRDDQYRALSMLAEVGIRSNLILGDPAGRFGTGTLEEQVATLEGQLPDVAAAVEGPNEFDNANTDNWATALRGYQERLFDSVSRDPELQHLPVVGPSLIDTSRWPEVGDLTDALDYGNAHPYPGGEPPDADQLEGQLELAKPASGSKPVFATETGYHNSLKPPEGQQPGVSEKAASAYIPRLLLEHFKLGIRRTFLYELADEKPEPAGRDPEQHFGLVRHDFSRKPAYAALKNMLGLLKDRGPSFETGSLDYKVKAGQPVSDLLLQKRDGRFYLVLWRPDAPAFSTETNKDVVPEPAAVEVTFPGGADQVASYVPARSPRPEKDWEDADSVRLQLGADAVVLELRAG